MIILTLFTFVNAQAQMEWLKSYGDDTAQSGYQTLKMNDSSIMLVGITQSIDFNSEEVLIIKISVNADTILTRRLGKSHVISTPTICPTSDNGFIVCYTAGKVDGKWYDIYISKFDSDVNILWEKKYSTTENETVKSVKQTKNGFILLGQYQILSQQGTDIELLLIKVDVNGDSLWTKKFLQVGFGKSIVVSQDNSYTFIGSLGDKMIKTDLNGDELWRRDFSLNSKGNYIEATNDGGYIITGITNSNFMLLKTDSDGYVEWNRQFGEYARSTGFCVKQVSDGGFIATGQVTNNIGHTSIYIIKTTNTGILVWSFMKKSEMPKGTVFENNVNPPISFDDKYYIEEIFPGQYIITGTVIDGFDFNIGLLKITELTSENVLSNKTTVSNFELSQNYPNPFNLSTLITYEILDESNARILIYDSMGNKIKKLIDEYHLKGKYKLQWNGKDDFGKAVGGGLYFYKLFVGDIAQTRKMILLK